MDYNPYLILYSGGVDSTCFIESEPTARHLIHYEGRNKELTRVALSNANILDRYVTLVQGSGHSRDGETNQIHALHDTLMVIDAGLRALSHGMSGVVACFNADDIGVDETSIQNIFSRVDSNFKFIQPLRGVSRASIVSNMVNSSLKTISCMNSEHCGYCAKCTKSP